MSTTSAATPELRHPSPSLTTTVAVLLRLRCVIARWLA